MKTITLTILVFAILISESPISFFLVNQAQGAGGSVCSDLKSGHEIVECFRFLNESKNRFIYSLNNARTNSKCYELSNYIERDLRDNKLKSNITCDMTSQVISILKDEPPYWVNCTEYVEAERDKHFARCMDRNHPKLSKRKWESLWRESVESCNKRGTQSDGGPIVRQYVFYVSSALPTRRESDKFQNSNNYLYIDCDVVIQSAKKYLDEQTPELVAARQIEANKLSLQKEELARQIELEAKIEDANLPDEFRLTGSEWTSKTGSVTSRVVWRSTCTNLKLSIAINGLHALGSLNTIRSVLNRNVTDDSAILPLIEKLIDDGKCNVRDIDIVDAEYISNDKLVYKSIIRLGLNGNRHFSRITEEIVSDNRDKYIIGVSESMDNTKLMPFDVNEYCSSKDERGLSAAIKEYICTPSNPGHIKLILSSNCNKEIKEEILHKLPGLDAASENSYRDAYNAGVLLGRCHHVGADVPMKGRLDQALGFIDEDYTVFYDDVILKYMSLYWAKSFVLSEHRDNGPYNSGPYNDEYLKLAEERGMPIDKAIAYVKLYGPSTNSIKFGEQEGIASGFPKRIELKIALNEYLMSKCRIGSSVADAVRSLVREKIYKSFLAEVWVNNNWCVTRSGPSEISLRVGNVYEMKCNKMDRDEIECRHKTQLFITVRPSMPYLQNMLNENDSENISLFRKESDGKWHVQAISEY